MKIQVGTKVKFLNDTGGGIVKGFSQDEMVLVETDDGFEMPVRFSDLIIAEPDLYSFDGEEKQPQAEPHLPGEPEKDTEFSFEAKKFVSHQGEVLLALVPENEKLLHVSNFGLYLINDSNYYFHYVVSSKDSGVFTLVASGSIEPDSKLEIQQYSQNTIAKVKEFRLQGIFYKPGLLDIAKPVDSGFAIDNISFYKIGFFKENDYFNSKALLLKNGTEITLKEAVDKLDDETLLKIAAHKEKRPDIKQTKSPKNNEIEEIDLHIEGIVDSHSELSNGEIIRIQLARFETALETALRSKVQRIVFIHGIGNGRLKHELRKKLDRSHPDLKYHDASFKEYGYGATMVYLR